MPVSASKVNRPPDTCSSRAPLMSQFLPHESVRHDDSSNEWRSLFDDDKAKFLEEGLCRTTDVGGQHWYALRARSLMNVAHEHRSNALPRVRASNIEVIDIATGLNIRVAHDAPVVLQDKRANRLHPMSPKILVDGLRRPGVDLIRGVVLARQLMHGGLKDRV